MLYNITSIQEFNELAKKNKPIVLYFTAKWCGPCKSLHPLIDKYKDIIDICVVDIDSSNDLSSCFDVTSIPRLLMFKSGSKVDDITGANGQKIVNSFNKIL